MAKTKPNKLKARLPRGFVDRSVKKGTTLRRAEAAGARARRLPLTEYAPRSDLHPILSINSVVAILAEVHSGDSWEAALQAHLPSRYVRRREFEEERRRRSATAGSPPLEEGGAQATGDDGVCCEGDGST